MNIFTLNVIDREGVHHTLEAIEGWRVMEVIRDYGLPIKAECGGACACATCHVYVNGSWVEKVPPRSEEEIERLDDAFCVEDNSRLSCQILINAELDGLEVTLAPAAD